MKCSCSCKCGKSCSCDCCGKCKECCGCKCCNRVTKQHFNLIEGAACDILGLLGFKVKLTRKK